MDPADTYKIKQAISSTCWEDPPRMLGASSKEHVLGSTNKP